MHVEGWTGMLDLQLNSKMRCPPQEVTHPTAPILAQDHLLIRRIKTLSDPKQISEVFTDISRYLDVPAQAPV